jgi:hypothetical protein
MYTILQGESLLIPATVVGDKNAITGIECELKASERGEIPPSSAAVVATLSVEDYTGSGIINGYLFSLINTTALTPGIYYVNYSYLVGTVVAKGNPKKVIVKAGVI